MPCRLPSSDDHDDERSSETDALSLSACLTSILRLASLHTVAVSKDTSCKFSNRIIVLAL